jgi:N-acetylmuramoyl-L-alanine amidase
MKRFLSAYVALTVLTLSTSCKVQQKVSMPKDVSIVSRQEWGAVKSVLPMRKHVPQQITIHHTAVKQAPARTLAEKLKGLQKFSIERGQLASGKVKEPWADIPYHFYIAADGSIGEGRPLQYVGDSNTPYDPTGHALIVLEGNFENEQLTEAQNQSLQKLVIAIARQYSIAPDKLSGHKDHADTACPGSNLYALIPQLKQVVADAGLAK